MDINYTENLSRIEGYKVDWDKTMDSISLDYLFDKLSKIQSYRSTIISLVKDGLQEKVMLYENFKASEINYENSLKYLMVTDEEVKKGKSDKAREIIADMRPSILILKKQLFEDEKKVNKIESYLRALDGYMKDLDKQADTVQNQIYLLNLDLKIHPDRMMRMIP